MFAVVYTGAKRFYDYTRSNHEYMFNQLRSNWPISIYDYTIDQINRSHYPQVEHAEILEVFDLYQAIANITEPCIIKLRTDIWFTQASIEVMIQECSLVADQQLDVGFIGMELSEDYATDYKRHPVDKTIKLQESIIIGRVKKLQPAKLALDGLQQDRKAVSINRALRHIILPDSKTVTVHTQLPLVVDDYMDAEDRQITMAYINAYGERMPAARTYWTLRTPKI
jgi:hypothetical protein